MNISRTVATGLDVNTGGIKRRTAGKVSQRVIKDATFWREDESGNGGKVISGGILWEIGT